MVTKVASANWTRQPSVFLAAALSTKVRSVTGLTLPVCRVPLAQCHQKPAPAWMWIVTTEVTVPNFTTVMCAGDGCFDERDGLPAAMGSTAAVADDFLWTREIKK